MRATPGQDFREAFGPLSIRVSFLGYRQELRLSNSDTLKPSRALSSQFFQCTLLFQPTAYYIHPSCYPNPKKQKEGIRVLCFLIYTSREYCLIFGPITCFRLEPEVVVKSVFDPSFEQENTSVLKFRTFLSTYYNLVIIVVRFYFWQF